MEFFEQIGLKISLIMAGFVGGIVSLIRFKDMTSITITIKVMSIFTGMASAVYGTPLICHFIETQSEELERGIAFALGIFGMELVVRLTQFVQSASFHVILKRMLPILLGSTVPKAEKDEEKIEKDEDKGEDKIVTEQRQPDS